jgi:hypothetical protein
MNDEHPSLWRIDFHYLDTTEDSSVIGFGHWFEGSITEAKAYAADFIHRNKMHRLVELESIHKASWLSMSG